MLEGTFAAFEAFSAGSGLQRLVRRAVVAHSMGTTGRRAGCRARRCRWYRPRDRRLFRREPERPRKSAMRRFGSTMCSRRAGPASKPYRQPRRWCFISHRVAERRATSVDGTLAEKPGFWSSDYLVHDPWRPAPSVGLHLGTPSDFADRAAIDDRADVAVYTSEPLDRPLFLVGHRTLSLFVTADRPSFDLDCTLSALAPDGAAISGDAGHKTVMAGRRRTR